MRQGTIIITPSAVAALTLAEIKQQVGIDPADTSDANEDARLSTLGLQAQDFLQRALGIPLLVETRETQLYEFPRCPPYIWLAAAHDLTVVSVSYIDATGAAIVLSGGLYDVDAVSQPARITPAPDVSWPSAPARPGAVKVRWQAGWTAETLPPVLKRAMLLLVGHWDANREAVVTGTISTEVQLTFDAVIDQFRSRWLG